MVNATAKLIIIRETTKLSAANYAASRAVLYRKPHKHTLHMNTEQLHALRHEKGTVLVEFYATWCPHCQRMMPVVDDIKALFDGRASVYQFDIDRDSELAGELNVESVPTFIIFKGGEEMWRTSGELPAETLSSKIEQYC